MPAGDWSHVAETGLGPMQCLPLTPGRFGDVERVMGERGVARRCFCMYWRRPDGGFGDDRDNRNRFADVVGEGPPPGLVGYAAGEPVGWVQVGPRGDFPTILRSPLVRPVDEAEPWSINCFVVRVGYRRKAVASGLAAAAVAYAVAGGAALIEAYPVDKAQWSAGDYYTGSLGMFLGLGFTEVARRKATRPIVRLAVG